MSPNDLSDLRLALRRVGGRLENVKDVEGIFVPNADGVCGTRLYGTLVSADARIAVGFDGLRVKLPPAGEVRMRLSGRPWLDETTGQVTIMVRGYECLGAGGAGGRGD